MFVSLLHICKIWEGHTMQWWAPVHSHRFSSVNVFTISFQSKGNFSSTKDMMDLNEPPKPFECTLMLCQLFISSIISFVEEKMAIQLKWNGENLVTGKLIPIDSQHVANLSLCVLRYTIAWFYFFFGITGEGI